MLHKRKITIKETLSNFLKRPVVLNLAMFLIVLLVAALSFVLGALTEKYKPFSNKAGGNPAGAANLPSPNAAANPKVPGPKTGDHIRGNKDAKIALVEYSDFDCPFCAKFHETAKQMFAEYGDKVMWVYRSFPLDQLHPEARKKAEASECVADLGGEDKYWQFADKLFADKPALKDLSSVVSQLGINKTAFETCLNSGKFAQKVQDQQKEGISLGVTGTPGDFIVNLSKSSSIRLGGAIPYTQLQQIINSALGQ